MLTSSKMTQQVTPSHSENALHFFSTYSIAWIYHRTFAVEKVGIALKTLQDLVMFFSIIFMTFSNVLDVFNKVFAKSRSLSRKKLTLQSIACIELGITVVVINLNWLYFKGFYRNCFCINFLKVVLTECFCITFLKGFWLNVSVSAFSWWFWLNVFVSAF